MSTFIQLAFAVWAIVATVLCVWGFRNYFRK